MPKPDAERTRGCDVVIVGGGSTGLTLACLLADAGVEVRVVEARPAAAGQPPGPAGAVGYGIRTSSISPVSRRILQRVGAWQAVPAVLRTPYLAMRVWQGAGARPLEFDAADAGLDELGHIVDNNALQHALEQAVAARPLISWRRPARLESLAVDASRAAVELDSGRMWARLVVGADGASSRVRDEAGIVARETDFKQRALVTIVQCAAGHASTAWQRFLPTGPIALLPLDGDRCSLIWSTVPEQAQALERAAESLVEEAVTAAIAGAPGPFRVDAPRASFPLRAVEARSYVAPRVALVGDAAHTVHPLAGQGVNLGLLGVASLADVVAQRHAIGRDIGLLTNLRPYERRCRGRNLVMGRALEGIHTLFGESTPLPPGVRSAGLSLVDRSTAAKRWFIRAASGEVGELPSAADSP